MASTSIEHDHTEACTECGWPIRRGVPTRPDTPNMREWQHVGYERTIHGGASLPIALVSRHLHEQNPDTEVPVIPVAVSIIEPSVMDPRIRAVLKAAVAWEGVIGDIPDPEPICTALEEAVRNLPMIEELRRELDQERLIVATGGPRSDETVPDGESGIGILPGL